MALAPAASASPEHNPRGRVLGVVHAGVRAPSSSAARRAAPLTAEAPLAYHGGPVVHNGHVYAIFWEPPGYSFPSDYKAAVAKYFSGVAADSGRHTNVYSVSRQYGDSAGAAGYNVTFSGAYTDTNAYPASACTNPHPLEAGAPLQEGHSVCLTDGQIRSQLQTFIAQHGLPAGMGTIYYVLTPPGVAACLDGGGATGHCSDFVGTIQEVEFAEAEELETEALISYRHSFCSYHAAIGSGGAGMV